MWQPSPAVVRQQQAGSEGRYAIRRRAVLVGPQDVARGRDWARVHGTRIFNPDRLRSHARLRHDDGLVTRVVAALRRCGWLAGGHVPAAAFILHSEQGCAAQAPYHFDFDANEVLVAAAKPFSVLLALEDGTTLDLLGGEQLALQKGDLLRWDGDLAHRGSAYLAAANTRFFMYVNADGVEAEEGHATYHYYERDEEAPAAPPAAAAVAGQAGQAEQAEQAARRRRHAAAHQLLTLRAPRPRSSAAAAAAGGGGCRGMGPWLRGQRCTRPVDAGTAALATPLCASCRAARAARAQAYRAAPPGRRRRHRAAARDTCTGCGAASAWPAHLQPPRTSRCHPCFRARAAALATTSRLRQDRRCAAARALRRAVVLAGRRAVRLLRDPQAAPRALAAALEALCAAAARLPGNQKNPTRLSRDLIHNNQSG